MKAYQKVEKVFRRRNHLTHLQSIASWDHSTMMPAGGNEARAQAMAEASVMQIELMESPELPELFSQAQSETSALNEWQKANLREMKETWLNLTCVEKDLIEKKSLAGSKCEMAWRELRPANNWKDFLPLLDQVVQLTREEAQQRSEKMNLPLYDSLLNLYEPGQSSQAIDAIFAKTKEVLPGLIQEITEKQKREETIQPQGPFPVSQQKELAQKIMQVLGFDFHRGRLDVSTHPFCGGVPQDVRITSRYDESDFISGLLGVIHETGHAAYEQGLPKEWLTQPVGSARGMGLHESQSLLFEMQVSRSREFLSFAISLMKEAFSEKASEDFWQEDNMYKLYTKVEPSYIRVDADEVTYPAHVILRYEIEKDLMEGKVETKDLPELWHQKMTAYLGLSTEGNFKDGCMQDIHWTDGSFGYFPTYTLGAMNAAQIFRKAKLDRPEISEEISQGSLNTLRSWLSDKIWSQGSFFSIDDLMLHATGEKLNPQYFIEHLKTRYLV